MTICKGNNCKRIAIYNFEGLYSEYCATHKLENMLNVKNVLNAKRNAQLLILKIYLRNIVQIAN